MRHRVYRRNTRTYYGAVPTVALPDTGQREGPMACTGRVVQIGAVAGGAMVYTSAESVR
jgi:hypothetical protein